MGNDTQLISNLEALIRNGELKEAQRQLSRLNRSELRDRDLLPLAVLSRRANLPNVALRLLNPIIRPTSRATRSPTEAEKAEYAANLVKIGAGEEALRILKELDPSRHPEVLLYTAFAHIVQWDYAATVPLLTQYVDSPGIESYQRFVGKLNLAAALVYLRDHAAAAPVLSELLAQSNKEGYKLLHGNVLELSAESAIVEGRWSEAEKYIEQARSSLQGRGGLYDLFIRKLSSVLQLMRAEGNKGGELKILHGVRREASELKHWETLRDCDRFEALATGDKDLLRHLYFGSPFKSFRERLVREMPSIDLSRDSYHWYPAGRSKGCPSFDILTGETDGLPRVSRMKPSQAIHRLMIALCSDFYRPIRLSLLHSLLYPNEFYNPESSPIRVYQVVKRLRGWLVKSRLPVEVEEKLGSVRLIARSAVCLRVSLCSTVGDRQAHFENRLRERWPSGPFTLREAESYLQLSARSLTRILDRARAERRVGRLTEGNRHSYFFLRARQEESVSSPYTAKASRK